MQETKILKLDHRIWWVTFMVIQTFLVAVMIGTLSTLNWVELSPTTAPIYNFKGSLYRIEEGLTTITDIFNPKIIFNLQHYSYERAGCAACFVVDSLNQTTTAVSTWNFYNAWCQLFKRLWFSAGLFIAFEVLSLVCLGILIVMMVFFITKRFYFKTTFYAGGCLWASHYVAILGWIGLAKMTFSNNCHDLYDGTSSPTVCAKQGPILGVFVLVFLPVVMIPFFIVVCIAKKKMERPEKKDTTMIMQNNKIDVNEDDEDEREKKFTSN